MAAQVSGEGAFQCGCSNARPSTESTTAVITVIQKDRVKVAAVIVVLRSSCVPTAHTAAATSAQSTASGRPDSWVSSYQSSSDTPRAAAATPSQLRGFNRAPKNQAPNNAEKIGMV